MAKRVIWAPDASRQWMQIWHYLIEAEADPKSIERLWLRILAVIGLLRRHPTMGRPTVEKNVSANETHRDTDDSGYKKEAVVKKCIG